MFCVEGLKAAGRCARAVCACLCCLICAGPILLIIGLIIILSHNGRQDRVDKYNKAVRQYEAPEGWNGTIGRRPVTLENTPVPVKGNKNGVDDATSTYVDVLLSGKLMPNPVSYNISNIVFSRKIDYIRNQQVEMSCSDVDGCSRRDMERKCENTYSGDYSGSGCNVKTSHCGTCTYKKYLQTYCAVAKKTNNGEYQEDRNTRSCFYPFKESDQEYHDGSSSSITFQLRASDDPFIALQRITKGDMSFGISAKQQRVTGLILVIIGVLCISCIALVGYALYRLINRARGGEQQPLHSNLQQNSAPSPSATPYSPQEQPPPQGYSYQQQQPQPGYNYPPQHPPSSAY